MNSQTALTPEDRKLLETNNWRAKKVREAISDGFQEKDAELIEDLVSDILDANYEVLDVEVPTHVDNDVLPNEDSPAPPSPIIKKGNGETVMLFVGHNKNTGARAVDGSDEWTTRNKVAVRAAELLNQKGYNCIVGYRNGRKGYTSAMRENGELSKKHKAKVSMELHFNAANGVAKGAEILVASTKTANTLGRAFGSRVNKDYPTYKLRGTKGVRLLKGGRGYGFNRFQPCPSGVYELFFGDTSDWYNHDESAEVEKEAWFVVHLIQRFFSYKK